MSVALLLAGQVAVAIAPVDAGDWRVFCDHRQRCVALSQVPEGGEPDAYPLVVLRRDGAVAAVDLPIPTTVAAGTRMTVAVDTRTIAELIAPGRGAGLSLPFSGKLAGALRRGRMLTLAEPGGRVRARVSLTGLTAAMSALADARPVPPAETVIDMPPVGAGAPRSLSRKQLEKLVGKPAKGCATIYARGYRLDAAHTLLEVVSPCRGAGALPYVAPDKGDPEPAVDLPATGAWEPARRRYAVLLPATPGRDCGVRRDFIWDGARFRLAEERVIAECRRATYEVTTYRAVVRGG
ncbi:hypothetical protein GCM10022253_24360 [Sphingomonas endophytica]|uniref:DUF1176 domain-containing protein n=1 Tax=Sphingomonas endophytica TaxID=869719 RepID=A0ABR6N2R8_9SPHN|nr:DUF1176 domain-containing protein [Sphingomonas endophytica]MBB5725084.1 hypothetical protein [Sphingomonas endophytica]